MAINRSWETYEASYRAREMKILAGWIMVGESGSVVGLPGCGRSNLLGFLSHRPEVLQRYLPPQAQAVAVIPVELNDLLVNDLSTFYRIILRAFDRVADRFEAPLQQAVADLYARRRAEQDFFLAQSGVYDLLKLFRDRRMQVVLVLNRFEDFCKNATWQMLNALRGLRDNFKDTLCYIVGMPQEINYLPEPQALGNMYELLDSHVCWVGPMQDQDACQVIAQETHAAPAPPDEADVARILTLTGNFPALLKVVCHWWLTAPNKLRRADWLLLLLAEHSVRHRLVKIWASLTQEEQWVMSELQKLYAQAHKKGKKPPAKALQTLADQQRWALNRLTAKGLCRPLDQGGRIVGELLAVYIAEMAGRGRGKIWLDEYGEIYQGDAHLKELTNLERSVLTFFLQHPGQRHTKTEILINCWPEEQRRNGITDYPLYTLIGELRKKIEPNTESPCYVINWRGKPEGGYQFFPEGRPG